MNWFKDLTSHLVKTIDLQGWSNHLNTPFSLMNQAKAHVKIGQVDDVNERITQWVFSGVSHKINDFRLSGLGSGKGACLTHFNAKIK